MRDDYVLSGICISVIVLVLFICFKLAQSERRELTRLIAQCLADGRKEYECRSMFRTTHSTTVIPIVTGR